MADAYQTALNAFLHWPMDWTVIGVAAILITLETIRSGANRACSLALALPIALLVFQSLPSTAILGTATEQLQAASVQSGIFIVLVVFIYFLAHRIIGFYADASSAPVQAIIAGAATTVLLVVFWIQISSLTVFWHFGPQIELLFGEAYRLWWLLLAYLALAFVRS